MSSRVEAVSHGNYMPLVGALSLSALTTASKKLTACVLSP